MSAMFRALCRQCGRTVWHNPTTKKDRPPGRCTYCGHPADNGNMTTPKRDLAREVMQRQTNRARLLNLT